MEPTEQTHFDELYNRHLRALKLRGMSDATIDSYSRAERRAPCVRIVFALFEINTSNRERTNYDNKIFKRKKRIHLGGLEKPETGM